MKITETILSKVKSIDLYINYLCGLRCSHCFIGDSLNTNAEMPLDIAKSIVKDFSKKGIKSITLLGGEPTLYKNIVELIVYIIDNNIEVRIVTNGQKSFLRLTENLPLGYLKKVHICFSIDGSSSVTHDNIRGKGTFNNLNNSISRANTLNLNISGIASISMDNYNEVNDIISLCASLKMKYLNIHYVTDRGFATKDKVLSINKWTKLVKEVEANNRQILVRIEKTFVPKGSRICCEVTNKENLIIDPYGRIYGCIMFMNFEQMETGRWSESDIVINDTQNENTICSDCSNGCPAMPIINNELVQSATEHQVIIDCIFNKTLLLPN